MDSGPATFLAEALQVASSVLAEAQNQNKAMEEELTFLTIQKWAALNYLYPSHSDKGRLTKMAKNLCIASGVEIKRIERTVTDAYGRTHPTYSNIYPRHLIDQAAMELGMVESVRPVSALH